MREIKFRVWDSRFKKWVDPDVVEIRACNGLMRGRRGGVGHVEHWHLSQFTGLKDKNGVEIYEGDIVKCPVPKHIGGEGGEFITEISFFGGVFGFMNMLCRTIKNPNDWRCEHDVTNSGWFFGGFSNLTGDEYSKAPKCDPQSGLCQLEVIGNIHENPELLEQ